MARKADFKTTVIRGAGANVASQLIGFICQTGCVIILARMLVPKDFGLVAMVTAFSQWVMNFGLNGFSEYIIQKKVIDHTIVSAIFWLHLSCALILALLFSCFGFFLGYFYGEPELWKIAVVMSTSSILHASYTCHLALLSRDMKFMSMAVARLVSILVSVLLALWAAMQAMGYWAIIIRQLTIPFAMGVACWMMCAWRPQWVRWSECKADIRLALKYAVQIYCNFTLTYLVRNVDKVLLGKFHGAVILGHYDRACHLSSLAANQLLTPLHGVALATLSRLRDKRDDFLNYYTKAVSIVAFLGTMAALVMTLTARDLILLLLGPKWSAAGNIVMAFGPGTAAMLVYGTHSWLHLSLGKPDRWLRWNLIAAGIHVLGYSVTAPFGGVAMALTCSVVNYLLFLPGIWYAGLPVNLDMQRLVKTIAPYFIAAFMVGAAWSYLSLYWWPFNSFLAHRDVWARIAITIVGAVLLWLTMLLLWQRNLKSIREIILFTRKVVPGAHS